MPTEPKDVEVHFDAQTQKVTFKQMRRFAIRADEVTVPVVAIEALYARLLTDSLAARGIVAGPQVNVAAPKPGLSVSA